MDKTEKETLPCGITKSQLAQWKKLYREVFVITIVHEGKVIQGVFRKPDMNSFSKALQYLAPDPSIPVPAKQVDKDGNDITPVAMPRDMMRAGLIYYLDCKLAVDKEMDEHEEVRAGACIQLVQQFKAAQATIKNL